MAPHSFVTKEIKFPIGRPLKVKQIMLLNNNQINKSDETNTFL